MKTYNSFSLAAVLAIAPALGAVAITGEIDLSPVGTQSFTVTGDVGGDAIVSDFFTLPAGTGVFEPFLTIERDASGGHPVGIEAGYNTDGFTDLFLDQQRPQWNDRLTMGQLAQINVAGNFYYAFELDANEPGSDKSLLSIDNIRIYTSSTDKTALVGDDETKLNLLGDLRWAMNDPLKSGNLYNVDTWIKLDSAQENVDAGPNSSNGGSGKSDLIIYVPVSAFAGALSTDYLWFYNLNGVHYSADYDPYNVNLGAEAGYEEWRAVVTVASVSDGGSTLVLLGLTCLAGGYLLRRSKLATV